MSWTPSAMSKRIGWGRRGPLRNLPPRTLGGGESQGEGAPGTRHTRSRSGCRGLVAGLVVLAALTGPAFGDEAADIVRDADRYRRPADSFTWRITITSHEAKKAPAVD